MHEVFILVIDQFVPNRHSDKAILGLVRHALANRIRIGVDSCSFK